MMFSRRHTLIGSLAASLTACATSDAKNKAEPAAASSDPSANQRFSHGIASGDPAADGFVIWTRITPLHPKEAISVRWDISTSPDFEKLALSGKTQTGADLDWTVKVEIDGLSSGQVWYYRFQVSDIRSPVGKTRTLPADDINQLRLAVLSCSNYPFGFFNVYDHIARQDDIDAVVHLGDYIYEYGVDGYGGETGKAIGRNHLPSHEVVTLADYRMRHAQYKADVSSQSMLAAHPLIAIWDDHETANNSWEAGAQNHQPTEGSWDERHHAALQAYYEWMPVRNPKPTRSQENLFRTYQWGKLLTLAAIETRLTARTKQLDYADILPTIKTPEDMAYFRSTVLGSEARYLLGDTQTSYLRNTLRSSKASDVTWRAIANQVIMADVNAPNLTDYANHPSIDEIEKELPEIRSFLAFTALGLPLNLDAWDGYPAARERFYKLAAAENVRDLLVLTGDTHEYWANDLFRQDGVKMGVELGVTGVTSPGSSAYFDAAAQDYSNRIVATNPSVLYNNSANNGYIDLTLREDGGVAEYVSVDTVLSATYNTFVSTRFDINQDAGSLKLTRRDS